MKKPAIKKGRRVASCEYCPEPCIKCGKMKKGMKDDKKGRVLEDELRV